MSRKTVPGELMKVADIEPPYGLIAALGVFVIVACIGTYYFAANQYGSECVLKETDQAWNYRTRVYGPCKLVQEKKVWESEWQKVSVEKWQAEYTSKEDVIDVTPRVENKVSDDCPPGFICLGETYDAASTKQKSKVIIGATK